MALFFALLSVRKHSGDSRGKRVKNKEIGAALTFDFFTGFWLMQINWRLKIAT